MMTKIATISEGGQSVQFTDRTVPWMKLGELTDKAVTAKEAASLGGLDFEVELRNVRFDCPVSDDTTSSTTCLITNRKAVVRTDTNEPLAIVSSGYPVLQYHEAFDFMDQVSPEYVAAGALKGGKQGFMVVRAPNGVQLNVLDGKDPHDLFIVLRTSHDLTRAVELMVMPLRGKCMNQMTLRSFNSGVQHRWTVKHTTTMQTKLQEALVSLKKLEDYATHFNAVVKKLVDVKVSDEKAKFVLSKVIKKRPKSQDVVDDILSRFQSSPTVGWNGTGWGLVNAVSDYFEWGRSGGTPESRFVAALQGQTHAAINKTAAILLTRAN